MVDLSNGDVLRQMDMGQPRTSAVDQFVAFRLRRNGVSEDGAAKTVNKDHVVLPASPVADDVGRRLLPVDPVRRRGVAESILRARRPKISQRFRVEFAVCGYHVSRPVIGMRIDEFDDIPQSVQPVIVHNGRVAVPTQSPDLPRLIANQHWISLLNGGIHRQRKPSLLFREGIIKQKYLVVPDWCSSSGHGAQLLWSQGWIQGYYTIGSHYAIRQPRPIGARLLRRSIAENPWCLRKDPIMMRPMSLAILCVVLVRLPFPASGKRTDNSKCLIRDGDRVVFYGDSITDSQLHPVLIDAFFHTRYPDGRVEFVNRGWSGDNAGNLERYARDCLALKPDVVTINMGFNDAGYSPLQSARLKAFVRNLTQMVERARQQNPDVRVALISPVSSEPPVSIDWISHPGYPYTLRCFAEEEGRLARRLALSFIDLNDAYGRTMGLGYLVSRETFGLSRDGVHPLEAGQTFVAFHILKGLGVSETVAETEIDLKKPRVTRAVGCKVSDLRVVDGTVSFTRHTDSLPWPIPDSARPFAFLDRIDDGINRDVVRFVNPVALAYAVWIDGSHVGDVGAEELVEGVNLSRFPNTPMLRQSAEVLSALRHKQDVEVTLWRRYLVPEAETPGSDPERTRAISDMRTDLRAATDAARRLAQPLSHQFELYPLTEPVDPYEKFLQADAAEMYLGAEAQPVRVDLTQKAVLDREFSLTISNPGRRERVGTMQWRDATGEWGLSEAATEFRVAAGQKITIATPIHPPARDSILPLPEAELKYPWSEAWPYPITQRVSPWALPSLTVPKSTRRIDVDGSLNDWEQAATVVLDDVTYISPAVSGRRRLWGGADDLSVTARFLWDEQFLYVAFTVKDSTFLQTHTDGMVWSGDGIHFGAVTSEKGEKDNFCEYFLALSPEGALPWQFRNTRLSGSGKSDQIPLRVSRDAEKGVCIYEAAIRWAVLAPIRPVMGNALRFAFGVSDADPVPDKGYQYLEWTPRSLIYGKDLRRFATLTLGE
ncbi:MAG: hypothetical protein COS85_04305 [Armatimonadetes bacterium CG07_land_8_20_14_0_80_59_28]|nr:MAG: hypothetical protein COS85_04305 [Armatimonadetes bacterium CG07_land_8_20_14_0_80_59_28]PIX41563.1 MAG: hypothetical protein COZ56_11685 [Armatimonadetes bacterium CG_4_8_14_3_um_filter_58_9]